MHVTIVQETRKLDEIKILIDYRMTWDALFINTDYDGSNYEGWDFYVQSDTLYSVESDYDYILASGGRNGHPAGIEADDLIPATGITVGRIRKLEPGVIRLYRILPLTKCVILS